MVRYKNKKIPPPLRAPPLTSLDVVKQRVPRVFVQFYHGLKNKILANPIPQLESQTYYKITLQINFSH